VIEDPSLLTIARNPRRLPDDVTATFLDLCR
jgi:hypothetical protein